MADERFDGILLQIAKQHQGIDALLDTFFSFLSRKTDFFTGADDGVAESSVKKAMEKYVDAADIIRKKRKAENERKTREMRAAAKRRTAAAEKTANAAVERLKKEAIEAEAAKAARKNTKGSVKVEILDDNDDNEDSHSDMGKDRERESDAVEGSGAKSTATALKAGVDDDTTAAATAGDSSDNVDADPDEDDDDSPKPEGNGGKTATYIWTQTLQEVVITFPVRAGIKAKHLNVKLGTEHLKLQIKGEDAICDGDLCKRIKAHDSTWTIENSDDGRQVVFYLAKHNDMEWWDCVIKGDASINTRKIVPENSKLSDLDNDTRGTYRLPCPRLTIRLPQICVSPFFKHRLFRSILHSQISLFLQPFFFFNFTVFCHIPTYHIRCCGEDDVRPTAESSWQTNQ